MDQSELLNLRAGNRNLTYCKPPVYQIYRKKKHSTEQRNTVNYVLETFTYNAPVLWTKLPSEYKLVRSLNAFKSKIKSRKYEICTCRLCKEYESSLGSRIYLSNKKKSQSIFLFNCMFELECNAHCVAFQKDPEKGYHWNDPR